MCSVHIFTEVKVCEKKERKKKRKRKKETSKMPHPTPTLFLLSCTPTPPPTPHTHRHQQQKEKKSTHTITPPPPKKKREEKKRERNKTEKNRLSYTVWEISLHTHDTVYLSICLGGQLTGSVWRLRYHWTGSGRRYDCFGTLTLKQWYGSMDSRDRSVSLTFILFYDVCITCNNQKQNEA